MLCKKAFAVTIIVLLVYNTFSVPLFAQQNLYRFEKIDVRNGLSGNQINSILKDEKGFIWFGTVSGLNRYDGYSFKTYRHRIGDSTSINDDYISQITKGPNHMLWVLTRNGWNIFDTRTEKFTAHLQPFLKTIGIPTDNFTWIVADPQNNFWFVLPGTGLCKYIPSGIRRL